ncbi:hypothetical protein [Actinomadura sp. NPDC049753]|uniref:hypothetical protein n=1 Tax=Actinomadura sp. NPDC049753 TaxID=3154739 RepID=UPI00343E25AE
MSARPARRKPDGREVLIRENEVLFPAIARGLGLPGVRGLTAEQDTAPPSASMGSQRLKGHSA